MPPNNEDGTVAKFEAGDEQNALIGHMWRKETGEMGIVGPDGICFWRLD